MGVRGGTRAEYDSPFGEIRQHSGGVVGDGAVERMVVPLAGFSDRITERASLEHRELEDGAAKGRMAALCCRTGNE